MQFPPLQTILRNRHDLFRSASTISVAPLLGLIILSAIGMAIYGATSGVTSHHWWQVANPAWKVVVAYWGTMLICVPSLYVFSLIRGARLTLKDFAVFIVGSMATVAIVLVSLAPIGGFFTWTSANPTDAKPIYYAAGVLAFLFGVRFLGDGYFFLHKRAKEQNHSSSRVIDVLIVWFVLFCVVMAQMIQELKL